MSIDSAFDKLPCPANSLPLSGINVFRASAGIPRNARTAALFSVPARLSGIIFAGRNLVFLSINVAI
jgi:hypothetical protein